MNFGINYWQLPTIRLISSGHSSTDEEQIPSNNREFV